MYDELLRDRKNEKEFADSHSHSPRVPENTKSTKTDRRIVEKSTKTATHDGKEFFTSRVNSGDSIPLLPLPIEKLIGLLCADYPRRDSIIKERTAPYNVIMEYRFLNYRILKAAIEIAGTRDALEFIGDIGNDTGYASSELWILTERVYKERKGAVKHNIARRLSLI